MGFENTVAITGEGVLKLTTADESFFDFIIIKV